jgi:hypothetical protein
LPSAGRRAKGSCGPKTVAQQGANMAQDRVGLPQSACQWLVLQSGRDGGDGVDRDWAARGCRSRIVWQFLLSRHQDRCPRGPSGLSDRRAERTYRCSERPDRRSERQDRRSGRPDRRSACQHPGPGTRPHVCYPSSGTRPSRGHPYPGNATWSVPSRPRAWNSALVSTPSRPGWTTILGVTRADCARQVNWRVGREITARQAARAGQA